MKDYPIASLAKCTTIAALCSLAAMATSCQKDTEGLKPADAQANVDQKRVTAQELNDIRQTFEASGLAQKLTDRKPTTGSATALEWQPQWQKAFKVQGAVHIPLLYKASNNTLHSFSNAKRFLVTGGPTFAIATYVFPSSQAATAAEDSPAFIDGFTGQLAQRELSKDRLRLMDMDHGRLRPSPKKEVGQDGTAAKTNDDCVYFTECHWIGSCPSSDTPNTAVTYGSQDCPEPGGEACRYNWGGSWMNYGTTTTSTGDCSGDPQGTFPNGWYKITARHSGMVLDVPGSTTTNNTQIVQWFDGNVNSGVSSNQKWYVTFEGNNLYSIKSRSSELASMNQVLAVQGASVDHAAVVIQDYTHTWAAPQWGQLWRLDDLGGGYYSLRSGSNINTLVAVLGAYTHAGAPLILWSKPFWQETGNEQFLFTPVAP